MNEQILHNAKRKLLKRYERTCPIGNETVEAILDDFIQEIEGKDD